MSIKKIKIKNFKSIKFIEIELNTLNCIIGKNGSGKSNILKALKYFYDNLTRDNSSKNIFDKENQYAEYTEITVDYDFSSILKIIRDREMIDEKLNPYFEKILSLFNYKNSHEYVETKEHIITATLTQYKKNNNRVWNLTDETRSLLKSIFPIYHIDSRHINLTDWNNLWDIIGDICKVKVEEQEEFESSMEENLQNKVVEALSYIQDEFNNNDINLQTFTNRQKLVHMFQFQLKGREFRHHENDLDYFSDGTNSYNYLRLLINLIKTITPLKFKNSLLIVDEPEIGLHPKFIDSLIESFTSITEPTRIIFTTHSSRMVKDMISSGANSVMYHTILKNRHTIITKLNESKDNRQANIITETEACCYFAKCILFYEGYTENELFNNKNLKSIFPLLKEIELYSFNGNNVGVKTIHPSNKNLEIPFLVLLDMDKIIAFDKKENIFSIKRDKFLNPLSVKEIEKKEKLLYGKKRIQTLNVRQQIIGYCNDVRFRFNDYGLPYDNYFYELRGLIKNYCKQYDIYPVSTTIEGVLINEGNIDIVFEWMCRRIDNKIVNINQKADYIKKLECFFNLEESLKYKVAALRLLHKGKSDNLLKYANSNKEKITGESQAKSKLDANSKFKKAYNDMNWYQVKKTSGWVSEFMNYFFNNYINNKKMTKEEEIETFKEHFKELYDIIKTIENKSKY
ncbi:DNA replication and repair protein RecF [Clostridium puniceum]|uniref:DNA replication and repair protein RecF n=1 Tax=Clostridium puniceum TaxID=29367 RepID=A0A1S8TL38_9CLOT|nr:retron Eco8 family effector endonuclease [Clostridium puniceum]OOM78319.1 DNA replication and repair protein RecF [Clostridium puniceum]